MLQRDWNELFDFVESQYNHQDVVDRQDCWARGLEQHLTRSARLIDWSNEQKIDQVGI